jgi:hypothetical protein
MIDLVGYRHDVGAGQLPELPDLRVGERQPLALAAGPSYSITPGP